MGFAAGSKRFRRDAFNIAARLRVITYVCESCGLWGGSTKPAQCKDCGSMAFLRFDSKAEAERWATLRLLEAQGEITNLRRQVRFPLTCYHAGLKQPVTFAHYVADFVYVDGGAEVREDLKGASITDVAALKVRMMEAQGQPVKLVKS